MDIDEFLDKETEVAVEEPKSPVESISKKTEDTEKIGEEAKSLKLEPPDIVDEVKKYIKKDDYFNEIKLSLEKNDFNMAEKSYYELWAKLSDNVVWNPSLHNNLKKIGVEIKDALNRNYSDVNKKSVIAQGILQKARENVVQGNHQAALSLYSELTDIHNEIPTFLYEEKRKIHNDILNLYMELKEKIDSIFLDKFNESLNQVKRMIVNAKIKLKNMDLDNAKNVYFDIVNIYNNLPRGFLSEKIDVANDILGLYKEISIGLEIKELGSQLGQEPSLRTKPATSGEEVWGFRKGIEHLREISLQRKIRLNTEAGRISDKYTLKKSRKVSKDTDLRKLLINRRLDRAKLKINKGLHNDAKKDIESILRLEPDNEKAKSILNNVIQSYKADTFSKNLLSSKPSHIKTRIHESKKWIEGLREMSSQRKRTLIKRPRSEAIKNLNVMTRGRKQKSEKIGKSLIKRRLDRAKLKINKGLYKDAKKDIESILRLEPDNEKAKSMLNKSIKK